MLPKTQRPHMIALGRSHMMAAASMQGSSASARGGTGSVLNRYRLVLAVWAVVLVFGSAFLLSDETSRSGTSAGAGVQELRAPGEAPALQPRKRTPGHQHCDADGGSCTCDKGYTGEHCEQAICEQGCMRGKCLRPSYCTCEEGYKGRACDEPVCTRGCGHGQCVQPEFCRCDSDWFGYTCDRQCVHGMFRQSSQVCECDAGWSGRDCVHALCNTTGCVHGDCTAPNVCQCHSGWDGGDCSVDQMAELAEDIMEGLALRVRHLPAMVVHKSDQFMRDGWSAIRKWTAHLQPQWRFGRSRFTEGIPLNDTIVKATEKRFRRCAAVGNSGGLLKAKIGDTIDDHDVVLRFNNAPTRTFEDFVGGKTTFKLLNRKWADTLLVKTPAELYGGIPEKKRRRRPTTLLWRAESYHYYSMLRKKFPDEQIYLLSPEFLIPIITLYKTVMFRMEQKNITWSSGQTAPTGFVGVAFLVQICDRVDVYGFDEPALTAGKTSRMRYHYFDKSEPAEPRATEFEHNLLRLLDSYGSIRLCSSDTIDRCTHDDEIMPLGRPTKHYGDVAPSGRARDVPIDFDASVMDSDADSD
ncbi:sialyltransferase [Pycnococcus provasolii]